VAVERHPSTPVQSRIVAVDASELVDMEVEIFENDERQEEKFLPDTGAEIDAIPMSTYVKRQPGTRLQAAVTPMTATGGPIKTEGKFTAVLSWQRGDGSNRYTYIEILVLHNLAQPVLSKYTQIRLGMLHKEYPHAALNVVRRREGALSQHGRGRRTSPTCRGPTDGRSIQRGKGKHA